MSKCDVPVFMIFFNRPEPLAQVFAAVREAKPSKLFLACDGPRENRVDDIENIKKCKEIVENIDWDCEVYKNYADTNLGCGMRMYSGLKWTFEHVDRAVVLEDDCVPHVDFFRFCEELLEKYKDDSRIQLINGMNHLEIYDEVPYDYFFGRSCCWGWATWKRTWDVMDFDMSFIDNEYAMNCAETVFPETKRIGKERKGLLLAGKKLSAWTYQYRMSRILNNQICIVPKRNMITNIGLTKDSGHAVDDVKKLPRKTRAYFGIPRYGIDFPIKHPKYVIFDNVYENRVLKKFNLNIFDRLEGIVRFTIYSDFKDVIKKVKKKLFK